MRAAVCKGGATDRNCNLDLYRAEFRRFDKVVDLKPNGRSMQPVCSFEVEDCGVIMLNRSLGNKNMLDKLALQSSGKALRKGYLGPNEDLRLHFKDGLSRN